MAGGRRKFTASAATRAGDETPADKLEDISNSLRDLLRLGNRPLPRINVFRGRADTRSWQTFVREVNDAANTARWSEADLLTLLPSWLTGEARSIYDGLTTVKKADWKALCLEMGNRLSIGDTAGLQRQVLSRRQRDGETIPEFGEDIRRLVARAFVDAQKYTNDQREAMAINIFRNGLRPNIRQFVLRSAKTSTLSEAIARAMEEENLQRELARDSLAEHHFDQLTELNNRVNALQAEPPRDRWRRPQWLPQRPFAPRQLGFRPSGRRQFAPRPFTPRSWAPRPFAPRPFFTPMPPQRPMNGARRVGGRGGNGAYRINAVQTDMESAENSVAANRNGQASSSQYLPMMCVIGLVAALASSIVLVEALPETLNLCAYPLYREVRPIPVLKDCSPPTTKQPEEIVDVAVWLPRADPFRFKAYYCSRVKRSICTEAYLTVFGRSKAKQANVYSALNSSECWQLLNDRELEGKKLARQGLNDYATQTTLTYQYGWWGEDCFTAEDFEVEVRTVGTMDGSSLLAGELATAGCKVEEKECSLPQGVLVWPSQAKELTCRYLKRGEYTAVYADSHVVVEALQASFVVGQRYLSATEEGCYPTQLYTATNDALVSFFNLPRQLGGRLKRTATTLVTARVWTGPTPPSTTPFTSNRSSTSKSSVMTRRFASSSLSTRTSPATQTSHTTPPSTSPPTRSTPPAATTRSTAAATTGTPWATEVYSTTALQSYEELLQKARVITTAAPAVEEPEEGVVEQWNDYDMVGNGADISPSPAYVAGPVVSDLVGRSVKMAEVKTPAVKERRAGSIVEDHTVVATFTTETDNNQANRNLNARVQFLEDRTQERAHEEFTRIYNDLCELENGDTRALLELLSRDATAAMRLYLQRSNVSARLMGEVVEVYDCTQVPTRETTIYWDKNVNGSCFDLIPVRHKGEVYFLKQLGQPDLQTTAKEVACSTVGELPVYHDPGENIYRTAEGKVRVEEWPDLMAYNPRKERIVFNTTTIYLSDTKELATKVEFLTGHKNKPLYDRQRLAPGTRNGPGPMEKLKSLGDNVVARVGEATASTIGWWEENKKKLALAVALTGSVAALLLLLMAGTYLVPCLAALATMCGMLRTGTRAVRAGTRRLGRAPTAQVNVVNVPTAPEEELVIDGFRLHTFIPPSCCLFTPKTPARLAETEVLLNGVPIVGLLDGGSSVTYARLSTIRGLGLEGVLKPPSILGASAVNYSPVSFIGEVPVSMEVAGLAVEIPVLVSRDEDCQTSLLLGADFELKINQLGYVIGVNRLTRRVWLRTAEDVEKLPGPEVAMINALTHLDDDLFAKRDGRGVVRVEETVELPARSDTFIWGVIEGEFAEQVPVLMKDEVDDLNDGVLIGKTVSCPGRTHRIPLRILNTGAADVVLYKHKRLGKVEILGSEYEVSEIHPPTQLNNVVVPYTPPELRLEEKLPVYADESCTLLDGLKLDESAISEEGKEALRVLILEFAEAFVGPDGRIGHYRGPHKHQIRLIDESKVVRMRPYPIPHALRAEVQRQIEDMLRQGIIRESNSPFCSPIILVKKADKRSYRFVVDYRALNSNTKRETYILPLISDILDEIGTKILFSTFDLAAGFHQVEMAEESRHRTAFGCFMGAYEFLRMPFGVAGGPKTLQDLMNTFRRQLSSKCLVYLDDVIIGSENEKEHLADLREFFALMMANGMKLKLEKCSFARKEVRYLGYLISEQGIRIDPKNVECVKKFRVPESLRELRSLIGAFGHFRRFIPHFAELMAPFYELTKHEEVKSRWKPLHQEVFEKLKLALVSPPTLASPRIGEPFRVDTDASKIALGACLLQKDSNDQLRPVQYASRKLNKHEKNYTTMELEALAIVFALRAFRMYLEGSGCTEIYTDNSALCTALKGKELSGRLARFQMAIQDFDFKVLHRSGKSNTFCDYLSRWPGEEENGEVDEKEVPLVAVVQVEEEEEEESPREKLKKATNKDPLFRHLLRQVQLDWRGEEGTKVPDELAPYYSLRNELEYRGGVLERDGRLVIPPSLRGEILALLHRCHGGIKKMQARARRLFWWPKMNADVEETASTCETCGELARRVAKVPLHQWPEAKFSWERVHIDFAGPFLSSMWLVVVDAHSRFPFVLRMATTTAEATIDALEELFALFGAPLSLVSDNGPQFTAERFQRTMRRWGIRHKTGAPYHPASNGLAERNVATFKETMTKLMADGHRTRQALRLFLLEYRASPHTTTGESPAKLFLRRELRTEADAYFVDWAPRQTKVRAQQKADFDKRAGRERTFKIGQTVWVENHSTIAHGKFRPGLIIAHLGSVMFDVEVDGVVRSFHVDQIRERRVLPPRRNTASASAATATEVEGGPEDPVPSASRDPAGDLLLAVGGGATSLIGGMA